MMRQAKAKKQTPWVKAKRIARFTWRHVLTLFILSIIFQAIFVGHIQGGNALGFLSLAIFLDWLKMKVSFQGVGSHCNSRGVYRGFQRMQTLQEQNPLNQHLVGTVTYLMHLGDDRRY